MKETTFVKEVVKQILSVPNLLNSHALTCELKHKDYLIENEYFEPFCKQGDTVTVYRIAIPNSFASVVVTNEMAEKLEGVMFKGINESPYPVKKKYLIDMGLNVEQYEHFEKVGFSLDFDFTLQNIARINNAMKKNYAMDFVVDGVAVVTDMGFGNVTELLLTDKYFHTSCLKDMATHLGDKLFILPMNEKELYLVSYTTGCLLDVVEKYEALLRFNNHKRECEGLQKISDTVFLYDDKRDKIITIDVTKERNNIAERMEEDMER